MADKHVCKWSTPTPAVTESVIETFGHDGTTVTLTFNQDVDPLQIANAMSARLANHNPPSETVTVSPSSEGPVTPTDAVVPPAVITAEVASKHPSVRAISTTPSTSVRLLIVAPTRGQALLNLPAGITGIAGPLGSTQAWSTTIPLQQTLTLSEVSADVPVQGPIQLALQISNPDAPKDLLIPALTIDPPIDIAITATDAGLAVNANFLPGETYRLSTTATWPDDASTRGHPLAAYTAESSVEINIPARPPGLWELDDSISHGQLRIAASKVPSANLIVRDQHDDEIFASSEIRWTAGSEVPALINTEELFSTLSTVTYHLNAEADSEPPTTWKTTVTIEQVAVRPQALVAAVFTWTKAILSGNEQADIPVRVVRLGRN
jgi:hypothetical protein